MSGLEIEWILLWPLLSQNNPGDRALLRSVPAMSFSDSTMISGNDHRIGIPALHFFESLQKFADEAICFGHSLKILRCAVAKMMSGMIDMVHVDE